MPSGSFRQVDVRCPYYIGDDGRHVITCEGILPHSKLQVRLRTREVYEETMLVYCSMAWEECPIAKLLNAKWEEK